MTVVMKRLRQVGAVLTHAGEVFRLRRVMAGAYARMHATFSNRNAVKFIGGYLSLAFSPRERFELIEYHYQFLEKEARHVRLADGVTLWAMVDDEGRSHDLRLQPVAMAPMEGEAELCFRLDGERLYTLTFSVVDGGKFGCGESPLIFVAGVQGAYFVRDRIRYAARKNDEIAPLGMLVLAAHALADIWGIKTIVGTSNKAQIASLQSVDGRSSTTDYDALWAHYGGIDDGRGHFRFPVSDPTAVGTEVSGTHRARTRRRRKRRIEIRESMLRAGALALEKDVCRHRSVPSPAPVVDRDRCAAVASEFATPVLVASGALGVRAVDLTTLLAW